MKPSRRTWAAVGVIGGAIALAVVVGVVVLGRGSGHVERATGATAPPLHALLANGRAVSLSGFAGKPVVIGFVLDYCETCIGSMHTLDQLSRRGVQTLALNVGAAPGVSAKAAAARLAEFGRSLGVRSPTFAGDEGQKTAAAYHVRLLETFVVLDARGLEVGRGIGLDAAQIEKTLHRA